MNDDKYISIFSRKMGRELGSYKSDTAGWWGHQQHNEGGYSDGLREGEASFGIHLEYFFYGVDVCCSTDVQTKVVLVCRHYDALLHCRPL